MGCVFCEIVINPQLASIIHADDIAVAFLDRRPVFKGHVLVVPTTHAPTLIEIADPGAYFQRVQLLIQAIEQGLGTDGVFVAINHRVSQSVQHLHTHLIPRRKGDGLRGFFWPRTRYEDQDEAIQFAESIRHAIPIETDATAFN
ncbi:HIT family protein [Catelliglobosispora koreensis]|uniref:HIT family protein n=1 Tax=Catelliglobosispora koreensis TaxID=129052 RepID=UPI00038086D3|nr:HIT family protein [Catelliglobosispora koreensis]